MGLADECGIRHVAIIMDGNGRWAKQRGLKHLEGHKRGAESVEKAIKISKEFGIEYLTLFAFSTENWKREKEEVDGLMSLLCSFIDKNLKEIERNALRVMSIGRLNELPEKVREKVRMATERTKGNTAGTVILALNYGGRAEIVDAAKSLAKDVKDGILGLDDIDEGSISSRLYAPGVPDPDLLIRTSGEMRVSNFLLWQISYSEIYVSDVLSPDFGEDEFKKAIESFKGRSRRFGGRK